MKLIVGLGNPGEKYKNNRHNVGFMFVDYLRETCNVKHITQEERKVFKKNKYLQPEIAEYQIKLHATRYTLHDFILAKPQTFMNNSGIAVKSCVTRYTLNVTRDLIIVHDDLDIPLGKFHIQKGVGPKLHNGIDSIEKEIGTKDFWRVRIGVDNRDPKNRIDGEAYVLQDFQPEEKKIVQQLFPVIFDRLKNSVDLLLLK